MTGRAPAETESAVSRRIGIKVMKPVMGETEFLRWRRPATTMRIWITPSSNGVALNTAEGSSLGVHAWSITS